MEGASSEYNLGGKRLCDRGVVNMADVCKFVPKQESKSFFKRHQQLFSFVGALIVFVTFVIKDNLREKWKGNAEALDSAKTFFALRDDLTNVTGLVENIRNMVIVQNAPKDSHQPSANKMQRDIEGMVNAIRNDLGTLEDSDPYFDRDMTVLSGLIEHLPDPGPDMTMFLPIKDSRNRWRTSVRSLLPKLQEFLPFAGQVVSKMQYPADSMTRLNELENEVLSIAKEGNDINLRALLLRKQVIQRADDLETQNKHYAEIAKWLSIALYVLGWGLGLVGKLSGGGDVASAD
jgi:hypothetical protein